MEKVSLLMKDSSEGDSQKETMIDFILSWTLRRSIQQTDWHRNDRRRASHFC